MVKETGFYALVSRMRYISRWGLMRSSIPENVQEHSHETAVYAHALGIIRREIFGKECDAERLAVLAIYHDASEILTGDLPTPIKYHDRTLRDAYKKVEHAADERLLAMLPEELAEMDECMPHYYQVTNNHGQGAETIMRAEALFCQGCFTDAHIELERAYAQVRGSRQVNMALCCDFLARRLSLFTDIGQRAKLEKRRERLLAHHNVSWLNLWNAAAAYHHALLGSTDSIPEAYRRHRLFTVRTLAPGKPMIEMIENQVYLAQGEYAHVIGRSEGLLTQCEAMHYALVALHIRILTAAAYEMLGKHIEARALLERALADAEPDGIALPCAVRSADLQATSGQGRFPRL